MHELTFVRGDLFGVIVAIKPIGVLVPFESGRMKLALGRRQQLEMPAGIAAAHQPSAHPDRPSQPGMRRDVADADADPAMAGPVRRRAVPAEGVMQ